MLRHIVQLVSNAHAVTELHHSDDDTVEQVRLATAIYSSVSLLNHSCVPMIVNNFSGWCCVCCETGETEWCVQAWS